MPFRHPRADGRSDDLLLAGLRAADPELSLAFVRRFQRTVFGVAYTVLADVRLAEDVAQQAFERAWTHAAMYDARRGSVGAWLAGITHNLAVDAGRARRPTPLDPADLDALLDAVTRTPEGDALATEAARELRAAIAALPPEQTRALVLAAYRGMTAAQVAAAESIPLGTAKSRIRAAMLRLHDVLDTRRVGND
jgi:RNA polymerase sigma-70 factor (ECF subfamily)